MTTHQASNPTFEFHKKSARKPIFINKSSAVPTKLKENVIANEISRISERCSTKTSKTKHLEKFSSLLTENGYSCNDITKSKCLAEKKKRKTNNNKKFYYFQMPFISDAFNNKIKRIFNKENINVRFSHQSITLRKFLNNNKTNKSCHLNNCPVKDAHKCLKRNIVYKIQYTKCHKFYIGSTIRHLHIRVREHLTQSTSSVYKHLLSCQSELQKHSVYTTILGHHHENINLRFLEHILIKQYRPNLNLQTDFHFLDPLLL